ncbi:MAG: MFS transporter [Alphaproteobacteria bacterium]|nr:MFS transporter [Alphaproteobacteria bacterium]
MTTQNAIRARWAVLVAFLLAGLLIGAWVPHIPLAEQRIGVGHGAFGLALLAIAAGAVLSMPLTGALINRFGSAPVVLATGLIFGFGFLLPVFAPSYWSFIAAAFVFGTGTGSMDVAMNAHGLAVEKALGRPIMSSLHAGWSVGCWIGAFGGSYLIGHFSAALEVYVAAAVFIVALVAACQFFLPSKVDKGLSESHFGWPTKATFGLGALCFLALMVEGSVADWGGIFTREKFGIDVALAAWGFAFYQGGMSASRFAGDFLRHRFGALNVVVASAALAAVGMGLALVSPSLPLTFVAYAAGGVGIGNLAPVLFAAGGRLEPDAPGRGIAAVVSMGYSGFLAGPPLIGFVAQFTSLGWALGLTVLGAMIIALFAKAVSPAERY